MFKYIRGWCDRKNLIPKPLRGSKSPLIWRFIEFLGQKNSPAKYHHKVAWKLNYFWKMDLNLFRQDIKKISLLIAFQQSRPKNRRLSPLLTNFGKKLLPLHRRRFKVLFFSFLPFLHIDPSNDFCFCKFFAKGLKSEEERLKVKFWSSEMVKIGRGQHNCRRCCRCHRSQSFVMIQTSV